MKYFFGKLVGFINGVIACFMGLCALAGCTYICETIRSVEDSKDPTKDCVKKVVNDCKPLS